MNQQPPPMALPGCLNVQLRMLVRLYITCAPTCQKSTNHERQAF
jgi:hypothetical protein